MDRAPIPSNLFHPLPEPRGDGEEDFQELLARSGVRMERIVSRGQVSPEGFWYDQPLDEWVLVLRGESILRLEDPAETRTLQPGDHLMIPAGRRHRVEFTADPTVWLVLWLGS